MGRSCIEFFTSHTGCPVAGEDSVNSPRRRGEATAACPGHKDCQAPVSEGGEVGPSLTERQFSPKALQQERVHWHPHRLLLYRKRQVLLEKSFLCRLLVHEICFHEVILLFLRHRLRQMKSLLLSVNFSLSNAFIFFFVCSCGACIDFGKNISLSSRGLPNF